MNSSAVRVFIMAGVCPNSGKALCLMWSEYESVPLVPLLHLPLHINSSSPIIFLHLPIIIHIILF